MKKPGRFKTWLIHKLGGKLESEIFIEPVKIYANVRKVIAQKSITKYDSAYQLYILLNKEDFEKCIKEELCNKLYEEQIKPTMELKKVDSYPPEVITYQVEYYIAENRGVHNE